MTESGKRSIERSAASPRRLQARLLAPPPSRGWGPRCVNGQGTASERPSIEAWPMHKFSQPHACVWLVASLATARGSAADRETERQRGSGRGGRARAGAGEAHSRPLGTAGHLSRRRFEAGRRRFGSGAGALSGASGSAPRGPELRKMRRRTSLMLMTCSFAGQP